MGVTDHLVGVGQHDQVQALVVEGPLLGVERKGLAVGMKQLEARVRQAGHRHRPQAMGYSVVGQGIEPRRSDLQGHLAKAGIQVPIHPVPLERQKQLSGGGGEPACPMRKGVYRMLIDCHHHPETGEEAAASGLRVRGIPAFSDNIIWLLDRPSVPPRAGGDSRRPAWAVDPGDAAPVMEALDELELTLEGVLITHHHGDHVGGLATLQRTFPSMVVWGPERCVADGVQCIAQPGGSLTLLDTPVEILALPGHTAEHLGYLLRGPDPWLFPGDTLFAAGCGRVLGGSLETLWASLQTLGALPPSTRIFCAHEYTEANLRFAQAAEPNNPEILARAHRVAALRAEGRCSLPSTIADEWRTNPFLRAQSLEEFVRRRQWKDRF